MIRSLFVRLCLGAFLIAVVGPVSAQISPIATLHIGDPAPPLKFQEWIRGKPVIQFEPGQVYVLDFWATWCGGCIISFPHISGIAEKYKGRVHFISVDTNEEVVLKDKSEKIDSVAAVKAFLPKPEGQALTLDIAVDGPSHSMWDNWIAKLHRVGLPTTFVINQNGKIAWVDVNLDHLEWVLDEVLANKWDSSRAAAALKERDAMEEKMMAWAMAQGKSKDSPETKAALKSLLDAAIAFAQHYPERKAMSGTYKVLAYIDLDHTKLAGALEEIAAEVHPRYLDLSDAAGLTVRENNLPKPADAAAAKVLERCFENEFPAINTCGKNATTYGRLAEAYSKAGENKRAVEAGRKAVALAGDEKLPVEVVSKLQEALKSYESEARK